MSYAMHRAIEAASRDDGLTEAGPRTSCAGWTPGSMRPPRRRRLRMEARPLREQGALCGSGAVGGGTRDARRWRRHRHTATDVVGLASGHGGQKDLVTDLAPLRYSILGHAWAEVAV